MVPPALQGLSQGVQKRLGFRHAMATVAKPLDQFGLAVDPILAGGDVAISLGEVLLLGFEVEHLPRGQGRITLEGRISPASASKV